MKHKVSLFIFRRDLRLEDNTTLIKALSESEQVIPCFIFDPKQLEKHPYKSESGVQFLRESLKDLNQQLEEKQTKLYLFEGKPVDVIEKLYKSNNISAVYFNKDYTSYSKKRDNSIEAWCIDNKVYCGSCHDVTIFPPDMVKKGDGTPYTIFTPFFRKSMQFPVTKPQNNTYTNYYSKEISFSLSSLPPLSTTENSFPKRNIFGGRKNALKILKEIHTKANYKETRDFPHIDSTTKLSAHHKFGTISVREAAQAVLSKLDQNSSLLQEIFWHDFFTYIGYHFPHVYGNAFNKKYQEIPWDKNNELLQKWKEGRTGFPLIDAGMRELNQTGYMHNRVRMVVASFLCKDLHIDWREGEKYFATKLIDYDPAINNGNWQWAASTGCDAQPYFRIFNPWLQQKKFDEDCIYIKKWIPELQDCEPKAIHNLEKQHPLGAEKYPRPMVTHSIEKDKTLHYYKTGFSKISKN